MNFDNENKNKMYDKIVEAINNYNPTIGMACDYDTFFNIEKRLISN